MLPRTMITIYVRNDKTFLSVPVTQTAAHEEELMKSDFVRLSWDDPTYYEIPIGAYIKLFPYSKDGEEKYTKFTLFQAYKPQRTANGYRYEPEFQHPIMWLKYVPLYFETRDASDNIVKKTEWPYVGSLDNLLNMVCTFVNNAFGFTGTECFTVVCIDIDPTQTVSVNFENNNVLGGIGNIAKALEAEYHFDWLNRVFYFGKIKLGTIPYDLIAEGNVGQPSISVSKDFYYNRFLVQGGTRNNTRKTENGNLPVNERLRLDETQYPDSIIDTRTSEYEPAITDVLIIDDVFPHMELYLYDLHERKKYKTDSDGNVTSERWSVWYFKLAYYDTKDKGEGLGSFVEDGTTYYWHEFKLYESGKTKVESKSEDITTENEWIETELEFSEVFPREGKDGKYQDVVKILAVDDNEAPLTPLTEVGVENDGRPKPRARFVPSLNDDGGEAFALLLDRVPIGGKLLIDDERVDLAELPAKNVNTSAVEGLVPSVAFIVNNSAGALVSPLGTREFEVVYNTKAVEFNQADDVEGHEGLSAGYFEIMKTEEGSDSLIVPTTSEEGIVPMGTKLPSKQSNLISLFNVAIGDEYKQTAQAELARRALEDIAAQQLDTNNYTFHSNAVKFYNDAPALYIGRLVTFTLENGMALTTRVLKLSTKIDYDFEQEITVGNKIIDGTRSIMQKEIDDLKGKVAQNATVSVIDSSSTQSEVVEYESWVNGTFYYYDTLNKRTGKIETSYVWHRQCLWMCKRTGTTDEPWFTSDDWVCVRATKLSLSTTVTRRILRQRYFVDATTVATTLGFLLTIGSDDITSEVKQSQAVWTRQSKGWEDDPVLAASDEIWNNAHRYGNLTIDIRKGDLPLNWETAKEVSFTITVTTDFAVETKTLTIH